MTEQDKAVERCVEMGTWKTMWLMGMLVMAIPPYNAAWLYRLIGMVVCGVFVWMSEDRPA